MLTQLNPPIPLVTPKGPGLAQAVIDYGIEHDLYWVVFQTETGECWTWKNKEIRADKNITVGRTKISEAIPATAPMEKRNLTRQTIFDTMKESWERSLKSPHGSSAGKESKSDWGCAHVAGLNLLSRKTMESNALQLSVKKPASEQARRPVTLVARAIKSSLIWLLNLFLVREPCSKRAVEACCNPTVVYHGPDEPKKIVRILAGTKDHWIGSKEYCGETGLECSLISYQDYENLVSVTERTL